MTTRSNVPPLGQVVAAPHRYELTVSAQGQIAKVLVNDVRPLGAVTKAWFAAARVQANRIAAHGHEHEIADLRNAKLRMQAQGEFEGDPDVESLVSPKPDVCTEDELLVFDDGVVIAATVLAIVELKSL